MKSKLAKDELTQKAIEDTRKFIAECNALKTDKAKDKKDYGDMLIDMIKGELQ